MKKYVISSLILSVLLFAGQSRASSVFSMWDEEDEELEFASSGSKSSFFSMWNSEDEELAPAKTNDSATMFSLSSWSDEDEERPSDVNNSSNHFSSVINPENRKISSSSSVVYQPVNFEALKEDRALTEDEIYNSVNKWQNGIVNVFWENYRGNNVRVEVLRNNNDLKEMRLKFVQSQNMTSDPDGSISDMLNKVANQVMKRTCGKKARQSIILYERPSVELTQETSANDYKVITKGSSLKEYGFRCIY